MSMFFYRPINYMKERVHKLKQGEDLAHDRRFHIISCHDIEIVNVMQWLNPINFEWNGAPFASNVLFEIYKNDECLKNLKDDETDPYACFTIQSFNDGRPMQLAVKDRKLSSFFEYLKSISFQGSMEELEDYCEN